MITNSLINDRNLTPTEIITKSFKSFFDTQIANDFLMYTTENFKNIPDWFLTIKNKNIKFINENDWTSKDNL